MDEAQNKVDQAWEEYEIAQAAYRAAMQRRRRLIEQGRLEDAMRVEISRLEHRIHVAMAAVSLTHSALYQVVRDGRTVRSNGHVHAAS